MAAGLAEVREKGRSNMACRTSHTDFYLFRGSRRIWYPLDHGSCCHLCFRCSARSVSRFAGTGSFRATRRIRPGADVRISGHHQYLRQSALDAGKGHDAAIHFLWWVFVDGGCPGNGVGAGVESQAR